MDLSNRLSAYLLRVFDGINDAFLQPPRRTVMFLSEAVAHVRKIVPVLSEGAYRFNDGPQLAHDLAVFLTSYIPSSFLVNFFCS